MLKIFCFQIVTALFCTSLIFADMTIGLYGVKTSTDIVNANEAGFNCVQSYEENPKVIETLASEAVKNGIGLVVFPNKIISDEKYRTEAKNYPVKAWYLFDEPDIYNISKQELIKLNEKVKNFYPKDKTVFLIGQNFKENSYYNISDILMVYGYPVQNLPLESFGKNIALTKQNLLIAGEEKKDLWAVVQMFGLKDYEQLKKFDDKIKRFLKKEEIRFMSYDALFNGATGLFYFNYYSENKPLPEQNPKEWSKIVEVIQEMSFVGEIIDNGKEIDNPVEIKEPIKAKSFEYGGIKYTFIMNPTSKRQNIPNLFFDPKFDVMYEKSTNLRKISKKAKNNFPAYKIFAFRYE